MVRLVMAVLFCFFTFIGQAQAPVWINTVAGGGDQLAHRAEVDVNGNVYVLGYFTGTNVDFDPSPTATSLLSSSGDRDVFVAKYDRSGLFK
ncbi:MAG: hypothetical protein EOP50_05070, partial [Sphingobacteriales bacterium]